MALRPIPLADFDQINEELRLFSQKLADKPQLVVLNKIDLPEARAHWPAVQARAKELGLLGTANLSGHGGGCTSADSQTI